MQRTSSTRFFVLYLVTIGFYGLPVLHRWVGALNRLPGERTYSFGGILLVCLLTCGFGWIYYMHQMSTDLVQRAGAPDDLPTRAVGVTVLSMILALVSGGFAFLLSLVLMAWACWMLQEQFNRIG